MAYGAEVRGPTGTVQIGGNRRLGRMIYSVRIGGGGSLNTYVHSFDSNRGQWVVIRESGVTTGNWNSGSLGWHNGTKNLTFSGSSAAVRIVGIMYS